MADLVRINRIIIESGMKKEFVAEKLGMSPTSLSNKLAGRTPFTIKEANAFCELFGITDAEEMRKLFFAPDVDISET
jgi:transcriptional regulator with XRE-family HTH domain